MDEYRRNYYDAFVRKIKANPELEKRWNALAKQQQENAFEHYYGHLDMRGNDEAVQYVIKLQEGYAQGKSYMQQFKESIE